MTAREQAREDAKSLWSAYRWDVQEDAAVAGADVASDVWEPILRELVEASKEIILDPDTLTKPYYRWHEAIGKANEALE